MSNNSEAGWMNRNRGMGMPLDTNKFLIREQPKQNMNQNQYTQNYQPPINSLGKKMSYMVERAPNEPFQEVPKQGSILLIWKDNNNNNPTQLEGNVFPTKSSLYIADFKDYDNEQQLVQYVEEYQAIIQRYSEAVNTTGSYEILVGGLVSGIRKLVII